MKAVFVVISCLFAFNSQAQKQEFIIKIEQLNGSVRYDTFDFRHIGKRYVGCIIPDQYETVKRLPIDTFPDTQSRVLSYEFSPPQYDSIIRIMEVRPAYSFYEINSKAKLPKGAKLVAPTWEIEVKSQYPVGRNLGVKRVNKLSSFLNETECLPFSVWELPSSITTYKRILKSPALLVQQNGDKTLTDTLKLPSKYLRELIIPERVVRVTTYRIVNPARIQVKSTLPNTIRQLKGRRLVREGLFSDIREFYVDCSPGTTVIAIQKSLKAEGYRVKINNIFDQRTKKALIAYQLKHNLPTGNLNMETLKALDIDRFQTYGTAEALNIEVECGIKNTKISDESLIDELIMLQALPDSEISNRGHCGLKTVKMRRKALGINEVKRQTIAFMK
jgi:Putative peptidoglycan binding domain